MRFAIAAVMLAVTAGQARASLIIDFQSGVTLLGDGRIDTVGPLSFSRDLTPSWPDGMTLNASSGNPGAYAGGYYGVNGEYFEFNAPVLFQSLDIKLDIYGSYTTVTAINASLYDSGLNLLGSMSVSNPVADQWQTLSFGIGNVSRVVIGFTGGAQTYSDGRNAGWVGIDNITYGLPQTVTPEPTSMTLAGFAGIGMAVGAWRRRRQERPQGA